MYDILISFETNCEQDTYVGEVRGKKLKHPMPIILSNRYLREKNFRDLMIGPINEDDPTNSDIGIFISANQLKWLQTKDAAAEFSILHEIGHYVLGHFNPALAKARSNRLMYIRNGTVSPFELAADEFAYRELGAEPCIKALTRMMNERKTQDAFHNVGNGEKAKAAMFEYQRRIAAIEELDRKNKK